MDINLLLFISAVYSSAFSISDVTEWTKGEMFFRIGIKSGKNKMYGLKWESPENVGTKMCFSLNFN